MHRRLLNTWARCCLGLLWLGCGGPSRPSGEAASTDKSAVSDAPAAPAAAKRQAPLRIGYSDWPGFVAWEIATQKGWFKQAGVEVEFAWFEYTPSLEAFAAGK